MANIAKILKKYEKYHWVEEEASISIHVMDYWSTCYLDWRKVFKNAKLFSFFFFWINKDHLYEWSCFEEGEKALAWILKTNHKNRKYLINKDKDYQVVNRQIDKLFYFFRDNDISNFSKNKLAKYLHELMSTGNKQFAYNLIAESMDVVDENYYKKLLANIPDNKLLDVVSLLSTPDHLAFLEKDNLGLLLIAKKYKSKKRAAFTDDLKKHQQDYFWIQNNYKEAKQIKLAYFKQSFQDIIENKSLKEINKEIKYLQNKSKILADKRKVTYKKYKISQQAKDFFTVLRLLAGWQDRRKENVQKLLSAVDKILDVIVKEHKINKKVLRQYFISELRNLLTTGKKVSATELKKREHIMFYTYIDKNNHIKKEIFYGQQIFKAKEYFQRHHKANQNQELKGFVASKGQGKNIVKGRARIILHAKGARLKAEEILVTGMTRPEFVPLMKQAKAIITNEGGITTHAAIVSRELKIPCIIGTKVATNVLKNGDQIAMNMKNGLIKII